MPALRSILDDLGMNRFNRKESYSFPVTEEFPLSAMNQVIPDSSISFNKTTIETLQINQSIKGGADGYDSGSGFWLGHDGDDYKFFIGDSAGDNLTWDGATLTVSGSLIAGDIHIPDLTTANSFHTNSTGNSWWGCNVADFAADNDNANAYVLNTGEAKFQNVTVTGTSNVSLGTGASILKANSTDGIWLGNGTFASAPFSVSLAGAIKGTSGTIGGWNLSSTVLRDGASDAASNVLIDSANNLIRLGPTTGDYLTVDGGNQRIRTSNYVSGFAGAGLTLEPNLLEVGNIACRGLLRTYVLEKDIISVNAGSLVVAPNADVLDADVTIGDTTITSKGTTTFAESDILRIKDGTNDEWMLVSDDSSAPDYEVLRDMGGMVKIFNMNSLTEDGTWVLSGAASIGVDSSNYKVSDASITVTDDGAGTAFGIQNTTLSLLDFTAYLGTAKFYGWFYFSAVTDISSVRLFFGQDISNRYAISGDRVGGGSLQVGWNLYEFSFLPGDYSIIGSPTTTNIDYMRLYITTPTPNTATVKWSGLWVLTDPNRSVITNCDTAVGWTAAGGATNLTLDTTTFQTGSGCINFDTNGTGSESYVYQTGLSVNLSSYEDTGLIRYWVYLPTTTGLTSMQCFWGETTWTDYWHATVTTDIDGAAFSTGWNQIEIDWANATKVGTPDASNTTFFRADLNGTIAADTDFRVDDAAIFPPSTDVSWKKGASIVNYGQVNDGGLYLTASDTNNPYMSIFTHAGEPWSTLDTRLRMGNLNGYLEYSSDIYGFGVGSSDGDDANITVDPVNGLRIRNGTTDKIIFDTNGNAFINNMVITRTLNAGESVSAGDAVFVSDGDSGEVQVVNGPGSSGSSSNWGDGTAIKKIAQSFQLSVTGYVGSIYFSTGSWSAGEIVYFDIQADSAGAPSGVSLTGGPSSYNAATGSTYRFNVPLNCTASTTYWVVCSTAAGVSVNFMHGTGYASGKAIQYDGAVWTNFTGSREDFEFDIYEILPLGYVGQARANVAGRYETFSGFAAESIALDGSGKVSITGLITGLTGLTPSQYYLSDTPGAISTSAGSATRKVGMAISETELLITNIW